MRITKLALIAMMVSSLVLVATVSVEAADEIIYDGTGDVSSMDSNGDTTLITYSPEIDINNLDLIQATYTQQGTRVTTTLQVNGLIQNKGKIMDPDNIGLNGTLDTVEYGFDVVTSSDEYIIRYANNTCNFSSNDVSRNLPSSDFYVDGNTLTVLFTLTNADETYESLSVSSSFTKINLSLFFNPPDDANLDDAFIILTDSAPNPPLAAVYVEASNVGSVGETIQFNGTVDTTTGQPPYSYHWDFGDDSISTEQNPTHIYKKARTYNYNFTVTDDASAKAYTSGSITITAEEGNGGSLSTQMILFLAVLILIIVIGIVVIVWIIRR